MKIISAKSPKNFVYIDESGIDNTEDYPYGYCRKGERFHALKSGKKTQNPNYGLNKEIKVQLRRGKQGKLEYFSNN